MIKNSEQNTVGWREWVALPQLNLPAIKAKLDTGARTSALHAFEIAPFTNEGAEWVRFAIHPIRNRPHVVVTCEAPVIDKRTVSDSGGHKERRYVIQTPLHLGDEQWDIEMTLTNRDNMLFRMLLGRTAMSGRLLVDSSASYAMGRMSKRKSVSCYQTTAEPAS